MDKVTPEIWFAQPRAAETRELSYGSTEVVDWDVVDSENHKIAYLPEVVGMVGENKEPLRYPNEKNAHLIAAAPQLYEMMILMLAKLPEGNEALYLKINTLLAKARGASHG